MHVPHVPKRNSARHSTGGTMRFTQTLFTAVQPLLQSIHAHPFNTELGAGVLAREKFIYYLQQDSLYLIDFARAFGLLAGRSTEEKDISLLLHFAQGALEGERSLHTTYFQEYGIPAGIVVEKGPACLAYTSYLLERAANANLSEAMAALLPCFWIYREVGNRILDTAAAPNPYSLWMETYAAEEFAQVVEEAVLFTDRLAAQAGDEERVRMHKAFMQASRLEYCFWDDAYRCAVWPL